MTETMTPEERWIYEGRQCDLARHIGIAGECLEWASELNEDGIRIPYASKLRLSGIAELLKEIIERNPLEDG